MRGAALWIPDRAEIIYIQHSPHLGREMPNEHPMLVCSTKSFNERTGIVIGYPMTHATYNEDNPFAVKVVAKNKEVGYVLAFQPKSFDWKARNARSHPWGGGHLRTLSAANSKLDLICGISETQR